MAFLFAIALAALLVTSVARADELSEELTALGTGSFDDKIDAVQRMGASGDPRAIPILEALTDRSLFVRSADGAVFIGEEQGKDVQLKDPLTLKPTETVDSATVDRITVNNRLRGAIRAALGSLTLLSTDPARRREAADATFKARPADAEPALVAALAKETDSTVRSHLETALAAVRLTNSTDTAQRLQALEILSKTASQDVRALVASVLITDASGAPSEPDAAVRSAATDALKRIDDHLAVWSVVRNLFYGISLGSVLLLAAVGLAVTFGVMGVINMAHGEMVMLGAYTTFVIQDVIRNYLPGAFDISILIAIPAAFLVAGAVGIVVERCIIRFLYGRPLETLLATWGLSLVLQQAVRTIFGPTNREVGNPSWMSGALEINDSLSLTFNRIWIIVFSLLVLGLLSLLLRRSRFGLEMRAVTQNRRMAASMGIRTGRVDALTFGLGSGIAGVAGVALSQIDNVSPNLGQSYIIDSFLVVVFGGVGNLWGTFVGAMSLGIVNKVLEPFAGAVLGKILVLIAIILFIQRRPRGLFAQKGRAVES